MPKIHCLQHETFEGLAVIKDWLDDKNFEVSYTHLYKAEKLPKISSIDCLIIMGGPMSVNDETIYPWLKTEKQFILDCINAGKVVIGICLGSQLIANALGSKVYPNTQKEIGWFPITKTKNTSSEISSILPDELTVFHWHGETFDLPQGATLLASSKACENQIFSLSEKVFGFQCHLEISSKALNGFVDGCDEELVPSTYIQSANKMLTLEKEYSQKMNTILFSILSKLIK